MRWWQEILLVGSGGFLGSVARFLAGEAVIRLGGAGYPWGTLLVNVVGCFGIGMLSAAAPSYSLDRRLFLQVGILGGFTTFSAFGLETLTLFRDGMMLRGVANVLLNVGLGVGAAAAGWALIRTS